MAVDRISRRYFSRLICSTAVGWSFPAQAQQSKNLQVGFLYPGPQSGVASRMGAVVAGMRAGGLSEPERMMVLRAADGNIALLAPMAADLVARKVDLIVAVSAGATGRNDKHSNPGWRSGK
jgi:hypothetical protein